MATIEVGTNSYGTEAGLQTYADDRGITISESDLSILLTKAMDNLESRSYKGDKYDREQALAQPRTWYDYTNGDEAGVVPDAFVDAQYMNALLIDSGEVLNAPIKRAVKKEKVDVLETEYQDNASSQTIYQSVDSLISKYLISSGSSFRVSNG